VPYRHVNNWILDTYEWLNGSLVDIVNLDNMGKLDHQVASFVGRLRNSFRLR